MKIKDLRISTKLIISYALIIVLFALSTVFSILEINTVSGSMEQFYNNEFNMVQLSVDMQSNLQGFAKCVARIGLGTMNGDNKTETEAQRYVDTKKSEARTFLSDYQDELAELNTYPIDALSDLETVNKQSDVLSSLYDNLIEYYDSNQLTRALSLTNDNLETCGSAISVALDNIIADTQESAASRFTQAQGMAKDVTFVCITLACIVLLLTAVLCIILTRSINRPLREMEKAAELIADGNLNIDIEYRSKNELGSLAHSLRTTISNLRIYIDALATCLSAIGNGQLNFRSDVEFRGDFVAIGKSLNDIATNLTGAILQIDTSAEQVMRGAEQIAGSGQALSQATLEQASSVEELSATINDISDRVRDTAEGAIATSKLAESVGADVVTSSQQMQKLSATMNEMREMSTQITGIIKDIEDIAFQTNILSLNAAVEAARAGDAGKGFSVVANEIRRLSTKTTEASKSTRELINRTVDMMTHSADMSNEASRNLMTVAQSAKDAAAKVAFISSSSNDQASAVVQLRESIEQISDIVQENSATAEESAASSEELNGQMQMLKKLVGTFQYDQTK